MKGRETGGKGSSRMEELKKNARVVFKEERKEWSM